MAFTYSKLSEVTVGATSVSSITINNIPQNYTDLKLVYSGRNSAAGAGIDLYISFNGTSANLTIKRMHGTGSSYNTYSGTVGDIGVDTPSGSTANTFSNMEVYIPNYTSTANKPYAAEAVNENNGTTAYIQLTSGLWSNSTAISSITLTPYSGSMVQYTTVTLYGVKAEV
jgi:hypothetical protein